MKNNKIKLVVRAGGLVETNSSSSHALSICNDFGMYAKPGDKEFDLDIKDGVLYIPCRDEDFGWEYEKSNSCLTKLQYVCGLFFNAWQPLSRQKKPKKLETLLKNYLKVDKVIFEWEEEYKDRHRDKDRSSRDETYLRSPNIDHNSYGESYEEIMESNSTIIDFIFNKNSWYFGGNDNSDPPEGYYIEMKSDKRETNGTISINYPPIGRIDFRVDLFYHDSYTRLANRLDIIDKIREFDDVGLFDNIYYFNGAFCISNDKFHSPLSSDVYTYLFEYRDKDSGKIKIVYTKGGFNRYDKDLIKLLCDEDFEGVFSKLGLNSYVEAEVSIISDEFGELC